MGLVSSLNLGGPPFAEERATIQEEHLAEETHRTFDTSPPNEHSPGEQTRRGLLLGGSALPFALGGFTGAVSQTRGRRLHVALAQDSKNQGCFRR